jgi:hypothetical protein
MTNDYTAEVGRSTGAVVNVLTKSGTNQFHGSAFEYVRNDKFDARDAFATTGNKPEYRQNNFGGSAGGPVWRNKTFFFADAEWDRLISGSTSLTHVPTASELADPTTVAGVPTGATLNPMALRYFKLYPAANIPGNSFYNYQSAPKKTQYATTTDVRIDHHFGPNDNFFVQYTYNPVTTTVPGALPTVSSDWAAVPRFLRAAACSHLLAHRRVLRRGCTWIMYISSTPMCCWNLEPGICGSISIPSP